MKFSNTKKATKILQGVCLITFLLNSSMVTAATLSLTSSSQNISAGTNVSVVLGISGLKPSSLGAYDLTLQYDNPIWNFTGGSFGNELGTTLFDTLAVDSNGFLHLAQVSLESPDSLNTAQPDSFALATLNFIVSNSLSGFSSTSMFTSNVILGDANGDPLTVSDKGSLTFFSTAPPSAIPLPATWLLFSAGLVFVEGTRRWSGKRRKTI
ncbi:MAG: cohesin domain-containing protein [Methylococcales bacterium]